MKNRAIINVSDTSLLAEFSRELVELGYEILCANNNISLMKENDVPYTAITDDAPVDADIGVRMEVMRSDIFAAILADRSDTDHISTIISSGVEPIDIIVTNFNDISAMLDDGTMDIVNIFSDVDINCSSLIKAGVSNCDDVCVVVDPDDYETVLQEIKNGGEVSKETRLRFAAKALSYLSSRDSLISTHLNMRLGGDSYPDILSFSYRKLSNLESGENAHQTAAVYSSLGSKSQNLCNMVKLQGEMLSFTGFNNADIALETVASFDECAVSIVNNGCVCGVGVGEEIYEAYSNAYRSSVSSLNGSVVVFNRIVDRKCALELVKYPFEGVIAPNFGADTEDVLSQKDGLSLYIIEKMDNKFYDMKPINGGLLIQKNKDMIASTPELQCVTQRQPDEPEIKDLLFSWKVTKNIRTSAVVISKSGQTVGIGGGQPMYLSSFELALKNAGSRAEGGVVAIDGTVNSPEFFYLIKDSGIRAVIQSGVGEIDKEIIDYCNENEISLLITNIQYCKY